MVINWDHPTAIQLRKEIVEGMVEELSMVDFARARKALYDADVNYRNSYVLTPEGEFYPKEWKETDPVVLEIPMDVSPYIRMPLESPTEVRGEFNGSES